MGRKLNRLFVKNRKKITKYESLSPKLIQEEYEYYREIFDEAMENDDIRNISVSGEYGVGKSSILKTFVDEKKLKDRSIWISLADFTGEQEVSTEGGRETEKQKDYLEQKILNQMKAQFRPKMGNKVKNIVKNGIFKILEFLVILYSVLALIYLFLIPNVTYFDWIREHEYYTLAYGEKIQLAVVMTWLVLGILILIYLFAKIPLTKLLSFVSVEASIGDITLSFDGKDTETLFDKNVSEIIQLFEKHEIKVVIIEDLDRYDNLQIFQELRELNNYINIGLKGRKVKFFYAMRNSIFGNDAENRTKFFDLTIYIKAFVGKGNAWEILSSLIFDKMKLVICQKKGKELCDYTMTKNIEKCRFRITKIVKHFYYAKKEN